MYQFSEQNDNFNFLEQIYSKQQKWTPPRLNLHIQISLGTKFQLKLEILIFWTKFVQKGYFRSKTENIEHHHRIMYIQISPQSFS